MCSAMTCRNGNNNRRHCQKDGLSVIRQAVKWWSMTSRQCIFPLYQHLPSSSDAGTKWHQVQRGESSEYLKEHKPELHAALGMKKTENGGLMAPHSMGKYAEALHLYATTTESIKSLAQRFGFNDCSFGQFIRRNFPELHEQHQKLVQQMKKTD